MDRTPMSRMMFLAAIASLCASCGELSPAVVGPPPDTLGGDRPAAVRVPEDYSADKAYPLVIELHGYGVNSTVQDLIFGLRDRVDAGQYILVLPEGTVNSQDKQFWRAGDYCCDFDDQGVDDVAYLSGLIEEAREKLSVDDARIVFVGHSNGAYMSYRMACERPDLIDRIFAIAAAEAEDDGTCDMAGQVSLVHLHGTEDETVPYASTLTYPTELDRDNLHARTVGAEAMVDRWAGRVGCDGARISSGSRDYFGEPASAETEVFVQEGCPDGVSVELWKAYGGDHVFLDRNAAFQEAVADYVTGGMPPGDSVR